MPLKPLDPIGGLLPLVGPKASKRIWNVGLQSQNFHEGTKNPSTQNFECSKPSCQLWLNKKSSKKVFLKSSGLKDSKNISYLQYSYVIKNHKK